MLMCKDERLSGEKDFRVLREFGEHLAAAIYDPRRRQKILRLTMPDGVRESGATVRQRA
jgi:hypothetical protein